MASSPFRRLLAPRFCISTGGSICLARPTATPRLHLLPTIILTGVQHSRFISLKPQRLPRNEEIIRANHLTAIYVDSDQVYHGLVHVPPLLASIDRSKYHLVLINSGDGTKNSPAVVRQYTHEALRQYEEQQAERAKEQYQKRKEQKATSLTKECQFTWAIGPHDLGIKLRKAGEILAKGMRVEIVIKGKRGMTKVTRAQAEELVLNIGKALAEKGGEEWKEREGDIGMVMTMYYQPLGRGRKGPVKKEALPEGEGGERREGAEGGQRIQPEDDMGRIQPDEQVPQSHHEYPPPPPLYPEWQGPR